GAAGTDAGKVGEAALENAGVVYSGLHALGQGAILAGLMLGALVAFVIDKKLLHAALTALIAAALSFIGLIHGEKVEWAANWKVSLGYLFVAVVCAGFALTKPAPREPEPGEEAFRDDGVTTVAETVAEPEPATA